MGVPKFYRWVSERYPCLSEVVKEFQIPEFDNLYLDMNGIIHVCAHPEDDNPHFRITEEKIFKDIMYYLEFLFRMIKPRKVFFMAVDGVAPRAKMNQQRGRRFRSAREAEELERKAREKGEELPTEKRFDSNCITPGTPFMVRLQQQLQYFVVNKLSTDPLWHGVRVYLSGHETPGEGEHKIMDFIRAERSQPGYDPNTRHVLHGLDADLMMLGLATHEPHFSLLREEVRFGGRKDRNKRPATPEETTFHLLHLSLFREYLDFEFSALKTKLPFPYDLERIIDDWVLMGFLVGNDFIPHLPNLHINHDALPLLWQTYIDVLPSCTGYLNEGGHLNLERFEAYLTALSKFDFETFSETVGDLKWLEGKKADASAEKAEMLSAARKFRKNAKKQENHFAALLDLPKDDMDGFLGLESSDASNDELSDELTLSDSDSEDTLDDEFRHHKRAYYMNKMEYEKVTPEVLRDQAEGYVRGIQWILLYYYEGVPSWSWYYPHHYAPYMSDVKDFKNMDIKFDLGTAFLPFEQLMAVLPAASRELLPQAYQSLMTMDSSPVIDFYPVDFSTDLNGKQQDWEAVVLIPFIDENRLLSAMREAEKNLNAEERQRNRHGPCLLFEYSADTLDMYPSSLPGAFPDILINHARKTEIPKDAFCLKSRDLVKGLLPGVKLNVYFPGFPTLKHIPHKAELRKEGVKVFQMNSRGYNVMLEILDQGEPDIQNVARDYLGKEIYVGWPHLYEAKIIAVCNDEVSHSLVETAPVKGAGKASSQVPKMSTKVERCDDNAANMFYREANNLKDRYKDRLGVVVGTTHILFKALPMTGRKYIFGSHGRITMSKQFGNQPVPFLMQTTVKDIAVHDPAFCQFKTMKEYLPEGSPVYMLGWPHYGCQGEVLETDTESGRVRVSLTIFEEPRMSGVMNNQQMHDERYLPGYVAAQRLGVSSQLFGRLTGTILVCKGEADLAREQQNPHKVNVGLNLKFTKRGEEIPGYTRLKDGQWSYAEKTVEIAREYMMKFPEMWKIISNTEKSHNDIFYESEVIPKTCDYTLKSVSEYIKSLPCYGLNTMKSGADIISEGVIKALETEADKIVEINKKRQKRVKMQVKPHLLFRPLPTSGALIPDSTTTYRLFDRVVNIRQGYSVPFGLRGTVVGVHPSEVEVNSVFEVLFDEEFHGGIAIRNSSLRGYRMPPSSLLNLTHGERKNGIKPTTPPGQPLNMHTQPQYGSQQAQGSGGGYGHHQGYQGQQQQYQGQRHRQVTSEHSYAAASQSGGYHRNQNQPGGGGYYGGQQGGYQNQHRAGSQDSFYPPKNQSEWSRQNQFANQKPGDKQSGQKMTEKQPGQSSEELSGKIFNGGASQPKFVTPKVSSTSSGSAGSRRLSQGETQPTAQQASSQENMAANSEFESMWKQLQSSMPASPPESGKPPAPGTSQHGPIFGPGTSLNQAASVLPSVTAPNAEENVNNSNADQGGQKIDVMSLFSQASKVYDMKQGSESAGAPQTSQQSDQASSGPTVSLARRSPNVSQANKSSNASQSTTGPHPTSKAGKVKSASDEERKKSLKPKESPSSSKVVSNDEFAAMFKSLSAAEASDEEEEEQTSTDPEEMREMFKKMLKISGDDEGTAISESEPLQQPNKNYGRQVSVQELFEGAKKQQEQSPADKGQKKGQGNQKPRQQQQQGQQQQQQYQNQNQNQKRPNLMIPPKKGGNRNPVMELMSFCQSLQLGLPMYDYMNKGPQHYCVVTLFNGQRFSGSMCKTREEAAESAAGQALLQLKGGMQQMPGHPMMAGGRGGGFVPPGMLPQGRQFSSPNSAFSPVNAFAGAFQAPYDQGRFPNPQQQRPYGQQHGRGGNRPGNYGNQGGGGYGNQSGYSNQGGYYGNQMGGNQQYYQQQGVGSGRQQHHQQQQQQQQQQPKTSQSVIKKEEGVTPPTNQKTAGGQVEGKTPTKTCVVNPFVPLQVTKKQTPTKARKESSEEPPSPSMAGESHVSNSRTSKSEDRQINSSHTSEKPTDVSKASVDKPSDVEPRTPPKQEPVKPSSAQQPNSTKKTPGSGKKPRRRIAAKFNFD